MSSLKEETCFVIGMEIIFDSRLEEALGECSFFDASDQDGLSLGGGDTTNHSEQDSGCTLGHDDDEEDEGDSGYTLGNSSGHTLEDDEEGSDEESSRARKKKDDDDLMARLAGAYIDSEAEVDSSSENEDSDDSESDSDGSLLSATSPIPGDRSQNTNIAVMMGDASRSSQDLMMSGFRRENNRGGNGRSRRTKGSRRRMDSTDSADPKRMMNLKDLTLVRGASSSGGMDQQKAVLQVTTNPVA